MTEPFFIFSLPRSRSYWLSRFLTQGGWTCHHDLVARLAHMGAIRKLMSEPRTGVADTGMVLGWRFVHHHFPEARFATIRRDRRDVEESLRKAGVDPAWADLDALERALDELAQQPFTLTLRFQDLDNESAVRTLVRHCLDIPFDRERWLALRHHNLQIDMPRRLAQLRRNHAALQRLRQMLRGADDRISA